MAARGLTLAGSFAEAFFEASRGESAFEAWQRFVYVTAYEIASAIGQDASPIADMAAAARAQAVARESAYAAMLGVWLSEIEERPFQDYMGEAFMRLGIGNAAGGQFFTPYHLARLNAVGALGELRELPSRGWVSVSEPACGAGANVIAACDVMSELGVDWQRGAYFVCRDVSEIAALMCYAQLSMVGVAATVVVGDTLRMERRYALHTPVAVVDDAWTVRYLRGELRDVW